MKTLLTILLLILLTSCYKGLIVTNEKCEGIVLRKEFPVDEYNYNHPRGKKYSFSFYGTVPHYDYTNLYTYCDKNICDSIETESKLWVYATVFHKVRDRGNETLHKLYAVKIDSVEITPYFRIYKDTAFLKPNGRGYVAKSLLQTRNKR